MKQQRFRQVLTIFSLFMLLALPTAIVGYGNFTNLVNQAFARPFKKEESTFLVQTESTSNISKGGQFSVKVTANATKSLPLKHFAAFVEFDKTKVDIKSVQVQNSKLLKVTTFGNGFLVYPATMVTPTEYKALLPEECSKSNTCDFADFSATSVTFTINGILVSELTEQQRPIKVTLLGAAETSTVAVWNEKLVLPSLKLGEYIKNSAPTFTSTPAKYITEETNFEYILSTKDEDGDVVSYTLRCPDEAYCAKGAENPEAVILEDNKLSWKSPIFRTEPYEVTVYANDGKSVSTQTFRLQVLQKSTAYTACTFTPALSVRILDYRVETPLVVVAESSENLSNAVVTLEKNGNKEKTFEYSFSPAQKYIILDQSSSPSLAYKFSEGTYTGTAVFTSETGNTFTCELTNPTVSLGALIKNALVKTARQLVSAVYAQVNVGTNNTPAFTTDPMSSPDNGGSSPSVSFVYGTPYSFTLRVKDVDGDPLQHTIVAKPSWANVAVTSTNATSGETQYNLQFTGTPTVKSAGSNLFSVSVNDGYGHYITRTWVINVDYPNNDIPKVTIVEPIKSTTRFQGSGFLLKWDVEDRHQVVSFGIYYTKDLGSASRTTYNANVSYKTRGIIVDTKSLAPGDYYFIVTATDGFSPPATGAGYTAMVRILPPKPKPTPTPKPTTSPKPTVTASATPSATATATPTPTPTEEATPEPDEISIQITSPKSQAELEAKDFQSVISLTASKNGIITKDDIKITLDGSLVTDNFTLSTEKGKSITASYKPNILLDPGIHQLNITVKDSAKKEKEVKVTFTIVEAQDENSNSVNFFGIYVDKKYYTLFIAGLILTIILVLLPIIMYFAFRNSNKDTVATSTRSPIAPITPPANPTLKTPTNSFAAPPTTNNSATATNYTPVLANKPSEATALQTQGDVPKVSSKEALASFVAHSHMEETPKKVTTPTITQQQPVVPMQSAKAEPVFTPKPAPRVMQMAEEIKKPAQVIQQPPKQQPTLQTQPVVVAKAPPTIPTFSKTATEPAPVVSAPPKMSEPMPMQKTESVPTEKVTPPVSPPATPILPKEQLKDLPPESPSLPKL